MSHRSRAKRDRSKGHWCWLNNEALEYLPVIGSSAFGVYCVLARHADNDTQKTSLRQATLAKEAGLSIAQVKRVLEVLIAQELVAVDSGKSKGGANTYDLV